MADEGDAESAAGSATLCSSSGPAEHGSEQTPAADRETTSAWGVAESSTPLLDSESSRVSRLSGVSVCDSAKNSDMSSSNSDWDVQLSSQPLIEQSGITGLSESDACALAAKGMAEKSSGGFVVHVRASSSVHEPLAPSAASLIGAHAFDLSSIKSEDNGV